MGNIIFVVWRESLEAMLVMGVLREWICQQPAPRRLQWGLAVGVLLGLGMAGGLAVAAYQAQRQLEGNGLEWLQFGMVLVAWALMLQMVFWMRRHGRHISRKIHAAVDTQRHATASAVSTVCCIAALAVAREGAETVVFVAGFAAQLAAWSAVGLVLAVCTGVAMAALSVAVLACGLRFVSHRVAFRISEVGMLLLASGLLCSALDQFIALDGIATFSSFTDLDPFAGPPLWDTRAWLPDASGAGRVLADFVGYRAQPTTAWLVLLGCYWSSVLWGLCHTSPRAHA